MYVSYRHHECVRRVYEEVCVSLWRALQTQLTISGNRVVQEHERTAKKGE